MRKIGKVDQKVSLLDENAQKTKKLSYIYALERGPSVRNPLFLSAI